MTSTDCYSPIAPVNVGRWTLGPNGVADAAAYYTACAKVALPAGTANHLVARHVEALAYADGMTAESARRVQHRAHLALVKGA